MKKFFIVFILFSLIGCTADTADSADSLQTVSLSPPTQTMVESMLTEHSHFLLVDFFDVIKKATVAVSEQDKKWVYLKDEAGDIEVSSWMLQDDTSYMVQEYYTENPVLLSHNILASFGSSSDYPFQTLRSEEQFLLNGEMVYTLDLQTSMFYITVNYQNVGMDMDSLYGESNLDGLMHFQVTYIDYQAPYLLQHAKGTVNFDTSSIRFDGLEYSFKHEVSQAQFFGYQ